MGKKPVPHALVSSRRLGRLFPKLRNEAMSATTPPAIIAHSPGDGCFLSTRSSKGQDCSGESHTSSAFTGGYQEFFRARCAHTNAPATARNVPATISHQ